MSFQPYSVQAGPSEDRSRYVIDRLQHFNRAHLSSDPVSAPLEVYAVDEGNKVMGGLVGKTVWSWLEVTALWVDAELRYQGLGSHLLQEAEREARRRDCVAARLSTWDFQAHRFYLRRGYTTYGELAGYPAGHTVYYLRKDLSKLALNDAMPPAIR